MASSTTSTAVVAVLHSALSRLPAVITSVCEVRLVRVYDKGIHPICRALYAEMLAALQSVGMDAVGVGGGENTISDSARAKVEAVLEKIGAPWPSSDTAAAAPVKVKDDV